MSLLTNDQKIKNITNNITFILTELNSVDDALIKKITCNEAYVQYLNKLLTDGEDYLYIIMSNLHNYHT
jgi:hypothetical protein